MIKVGYCAGHGYNTPGKRTPDDEREWTFNHIVAQAFANELASYEGVVSKRFDDSTGRRDVPLQERTNNANSWGAQYYISFHHNALGATWGNHTGVETFVYIGNSNTTSGKLAKAIHPALVKAYGLKDRGIKEANLHVVRETKMPAILIEGGFMDSTIDIVKLRDQNVLENAGRMIAQALAAYLKLKKMNIPIEEREKSVVLLNETGRAEIRELLKKARSAGIINAKVHTDAAIAKYDDIQLLSYQAAVINRTFTK